jgi:hypothetical protein
MTNDEMIRHRRRLRTQTFCTGGWATLSPSHSSLLAASDLIPSDTPLGASSSLAAQMEMDADVRDLLRGGSDAG